MFFFLARKASGISLLSPSTRSSRSPPSLIHPISAAITFQPEASIIRESVILELFDGTGRGKIFFGDALGVGVKNLGSLRLGLQLAASPALLRASKAFAFGRICMESSLHGRGTYVNAVLRTFILWFNAQRLFQLRVPSRNSGGRVANINALAPS